MGNKLNNFVKFPMKIANSTQKYSLDRSVYELRGVIEHKGRSSRMGHYFCYLKNGEDWFLVIFPLKIGK